MGVFSPVHVLVVLAILIIVAYVVIQNTQLKKHVNFSDPRVRIAGVIGLVVVIVIVGVAGRTKHGDLRSSLSTTTGSPDQDVTDPVVSAIKSDIETPVFFALDAGGFYLNDSNEVATLTGVLVSASYSFDKSNVECIPSRFEFKYAPEAKFMAGNILSRFQKFGSLLYADGKYKMTPAMDLYQVGWTQRGYCARFQFYNLGHFSLASANLLNEFEGPDKKTGSITKMRSYKVRVEFIPSSKVASIMAQATYGHFEWTVAFAKNPVSTEWEITDRTGATWNPN